MLANVAHRWVHPEVQKKKPPERLGSPGGGGFRYFRERLDETDRSVVSFLCREAQRTWASMPAFAASGSQNSPQELPMRTRDSCPGPWYG